MTPNYNRRPQTRTFEPAWFLTQLTNGLSEPSLSRRWVTLNTFQVSFLKSQHMESDRNYLATLSRLCQRPDGNYADSSDVAEALRKLMAFNQLFWAVKQNGEKVNDRDILEYKGNMLVKSLDEDVYLLTMREVAKFVAWYFRKAVPPEIMKATQEVAEAADTGSIMIDLSDSDLAENQAQRLPIVLIVDNSTPMEPDIKAVTDGISDIFELIRGNKGMQRGAEICLVTTATDGKAQLLADFTTAGACERRLVENTALLAGKGPSHLDDAIDLALDALARFKKGMDGVGQHVLTPWVGIFSCGRWLRSATVNTRLDECIERLRAMNRKEVHDISLHVVAVNRKALSDDRQKANLQSLGCEIHCGTDMRTLFNEVFMSVKRVRESSFPDSEGGGDDGRPAIEGVQLKNSGSI